MDPRNWESLSATELRVLKEQETRMACDLEDAGQDATTEWGNVSYLDALMMKKLGERP